jgi:signal transduction histidine kinase/DNA-binding response OmpR family regulator
MNGNHASGDISVPKGADLLAVACNRLARTRVPACIKDSELRYVAVSAAFAALHRLDARQFVGLTDADLPNGRMSSLRDEMERKAIVFGQDAEIDLAIGGTELAQRLRIEQFVSDSGDIYIYEHVDPLVAPPLAPAPWWETHAASVPPPVSASTTAPAPVFQTADPTFLEVLKDALSHIDAGILIIDPLGCVAFCNDKMEQLYLSFMGSIRAGERLSDVLARGIGRGLSPRVDPTDAAACEAWVENRLASFSDAYFEDIQQTRGGRWIKAINRRLDNGYVVGLRLDITDSKEREALLIRQKEEVSLYKAVLDALPVPVFVRDEAHIMVYANEVERQLVAERKLDALGFDERGVFGDDADSYIEENDRVLRTGEVSERETMMQHRSESATHILSRISRAELPDGKRYIVGSLTDMSALRQREAELRQAHVQAETARRQLENIVDSIDTGIIVVRQDDLIIELANKDVLRKWEGTPLEGLVGHSFMEMMDHNEKTGVFDLTGPQLEAAKARWREAIASGEVPMLEFSTRQGEVYVAQGHQIGGGRLVLTYTDITQLRSRDKAIGEARAKLAETGALMNEALVTMAQGLVMVSPAGEVQISNDAVARLLDAPSELLKVGGRWEELFAFCAMRGDFGDDPEAFLKNLAEHALERRQADVCFCVGGARWIRLELRPVEGGGTIGLLTDITELHGRQRELEELLRRAEKADRAKSDFLASVSHEFRTPMNGVLSMTELLARSDLDTRQKTYVNAIGKSAKSLLTIINDILEFSKLNSGQLQLNPVQFDPLECVDDVATILAAKAEEKDLILAVSPSHDLPKRIFGDPLRFRQMIFNLVTNAIRFTDRGHIEIRLLTVSDGDAGQRLVLEVEDTGRGMSAEQKQSLLDVSAHATKMHVGRADGLGLGLPTAFGLARLFGGSVSVESELGRGSVFRLSLPFEPGGVANERMDILPAIGARVLVVDDVDVSRNSIGAMLSGWRFDATGVATVEEAVAVLEAAHEARLSIDVLIVSSSLPKRGARKLVETLHGDPRYAATSVILVTSVLSDGLRGSGDIAAEAQLQRPIRSSLLLDTLCDVMAARRKSSNPLNGEPAQRQALRVPAAPDRIDVLVAEDSEVSALACEQILSSLGLSYRIARDGEEAVRDWQLFKPDIVIMDILMPRMNGYEATAAIRAAEERAEMHRTPIIGITARTLEHDRNACLDAGMDDYLPKPFTPELLAAKIDIWRSVVEGEAKITDGFIRSA